MKYKKEYRAEIIMKEGLAKTAKLIKFMKKEESLDRETPITGKVNVTLMNLQQKAILTYVDKWENSFSEKRNFSKIYCYSTFFVRQIENYYKQGFAPQIEKKAQGYLVYEYSGKQLGGGKGNWIERLKEEDLYDLYDE